MVVYFNNFNSERDTWIAKKSTFKKADFKIFNLDINDFKYFDKNLDLGFSCFSVVKIFNNKKQIIAKRDIFGTIPLFFLWKKNGLCVFSDDLSLLVSEFGCSISKERIELYLNNVDLDKFQKSHITFYENIYQVPAGSVVSIKRDNIHIEFVNYQSSMTKGFLLKELKLSLETLIKNEQKVAIHVSGGLDSTTLASLVAGSKLKKFGIHYCVTKTAFKSTSEKSFQKSFEKKFGEKIKQYTTEANILNITKQYCQIAYQPPLLFNTISLFDKTLKSLEEESINILVSGHGGDQVLGHGFEYINELKKEKKYTKINRFVKLLSQKGLLRNNFENWTSFSRNKKFNLTLQALVFPINTIYTKSILCRIREYNAVGGKISYIFTSSFNSLFNKILRRNVPPVLNKLNCAKNADIYTGDKNRTHENVQNATFSNINETFYNFEKLYYTKFLFPFLNTKVYAASNAYSLKEKFGDGRGRNHLRIELKGVLPEKVRKRIGKTSFDEYFVKEIEIYYSLVGKINENHLLWTFVSKKWFYIRLNELMNKNISYFKKKNAAHFIHRCLNIKVWLDFVTNLK